MRWLHIPVKQRETFLQWLEDYAAASSDPREQRQIREVLVPVVRYGFEEFTNDPFGEYSFEALAASLGVDRHNARDMLHVLCAKFREQRGGKQNQIPMVAYPMQRPLRRA